MTYDRWQQFMETSLLQHLIRKSYMYVEWLLVSIIFLLFAYKSKVNSDRKREKVPVDKNVHLVIEYALSNKVDLMKGIYTVFFMGKPPVDIIFELTPAEKDQIIKQYYSLSIDKLNEVDEITGIVYIEDECMIMPTTYTYLIVRKDSITQRIQIDEGCDNYRSGNSDKAKRVKEFLQYVDKIIQSKPEVKNSPHSDIIYI
jgi:hypothetical protein